MYDALIIGGGPAGLSMAMALSRQVYSVLVLDSHEYRNARASHMHTVPGFDHADPASFRAKVREDLVGRYPSVEFRSARIRAVRKEDGGGGGGTFEADDDEGNTYAGKKLGLGTGVEDVPPGDVEGYDECWARGVFHCLFCHGFEERGASSVGVLAGGLMTKPGMLAHVALMAKRLADSTTIYTNGDEDLLDQTRPLLHSSKIHFDNRRIARLQLVNGTGPSVVVHFADGQSASKTEGFMANHPQVRPRSASLAEQLGLERSSPGGDLVVSSPWNETSVRGCFAAGDNATAMKSAVQAIQMGCFAGGGMCASLQADLDASDEI